MINSEADMFFIIKIVVNNRVINGIKQIIVLGSHDHYKRFVCVCVHHFVCVCAILFNTKKGRCPLQKGLKERNFQLRSEPHRGEYCQAQLQSTSTSSWKLR